MDDIIKAVQQKRKKTINQIGNDFGGIDLIKGKAAQEGETREWGGKKYKKQNGKWIPVGNDKNSSEKSSPKNNGDKKPDNNKSDHKDVGGHDLAQLTHIKKIMKENPSKAYEMYQKLSPEIQDKVPQDVVNSLVESGNAEEPSHQYNQEVFDEIKNIGGSGLSDEDIALVFDEVERLWTPRQLKSERGKSQQAHTENLWKKVGQISLPLDPKLLTQVKPSNVEDILYAMVTYTTDYNDGELLFKQSDNGKKDKKVS